MKFKGRLEMRKPGAVRILNRIVTVANDGLEYEADQRHAEILMTDMGIDEGSKGVTTPGSNSKGGQEVRGEVTGDRGESRYRAVAARGNDLGQDRMDTQFVAKEISRSTSKPEEQDWRAAKRLASYLKDHQRVVLEHKYQKLPNQVVAWSDTEFAGCGRTRRSTHTA